MAIKKNTKIIFEEGYGNAGKELLGGIPLSKGEILHVYEDDSDESVDYLVVEKRTDLFYKGKDQIVDTTYTLRKQES